MGLCCSWINSGCLPRAGVRGQLRFVPADAASTLLIQDTSSHEAAGTSVSSTGAEDLSVQHPETIFVHSSQHHRQPQRPLEGVHVLQSVEGEETQVHTAARVDSLTNSAGPTRREGIDYSRWDNLVVDSDEEDEKKKSVTVAVFGFTGVDAPHINGHYRIVTDTNHGMPVFRRDVRPGHATAGDFPTSFLYYWDDRDGEHLRGWWFGPAVGSNTVWAFNPGHSSEPPALGWREPWFYDASPSARALISQASNPDWISQPPSLEEALPAKVRGKLLPAVAHMRGVSSTWRCVECQAPLRSPVVLACGHMVCSCHVINNGNERYSCPWSLSCSARQFPAGVGEDGWRVGHVAERLLQIAPPPTEAIPLPAMCFYADQARAVRAARTPRELAEAYEELGDDLGEDGRAADAAVAFVAARLLLEEFGVVSLQDVGSQDHQTMAALNIADSRTADCLAPVLHTHKIVRAKAAAWAKRTGSSSALDTAVARMPVPQKPQNADDGWSLQQFADSLRASVDSDETLTSLLECPVCYSMLFEPVTTPCGHTYCKRCLARSLDWENDCPLCRGNLAGFIDNYSICEPLNNLLHMIAPETQDRRRLEEADELLCAPVDGQWLAVLSPLLAVPYQECTIHIQEPRHRLLMRRVVSSGTNCIGACVRDSTTSDAPLYGTELTVGRIRMLPDGGSLVEVTGGKRFQVLESKAVEGYSKARIIYVEDVATAACASDEGLTAAMALSRQGNAISVLQWTMLALSISTQEVHQLAGSQRDELIWAMLLDVPSSVDAKARFLGITSQAERLNALLEILREASESLSATSAGPAPSPS